ncbi:MAG TPA: hypothetical protein PK059_02075 [Cyclobacteriaceae bacterium]|nr:hypothetical protein [Cyclobacteriaceae bacterium]
MTIEIGGKERPVSMKMLAVREYKKLTGFNLAGGSHTFADIIGDGKEKEFNPDLFIAFLYCVLVNGCHPDKPDFDLDAVANWMNMYDRTLSGKLMNLYLEEMTGKSAEEVLDEVKKKMKEPEPSPGTTSSALPTES